MRIDAIAIGKNPPEDVNVIIEVPVGGQPITPASRSRAISSQLRPISTRTNSVRVL